MDSPVESFAQAELERSLTEQNYGLKKFEITKKSLLESTAEVTTLEGDTVVITLTPRGYQASFTAMRFTVCLITAIDSVRYAHRRGPGIRNGGGRVTSSQSIVCTSETETARGKAVFYSTQTNRAARSFGVALCSPKSFRRSFHDATCLLPTVQSCLVHTSCEDEIFILSHPPDKAANPLPFLRIPDAVCPPMIHTALKHRSAQFSVFALLVKDMQNKAGIEAFET